MWKELQLAKDSVVSPKSSDKKSQSLDSTKDSAVKSYGSSSTISLQSAAQALGKITLPTVDLLEEPSGTLDSKSSDADTNPPIGLLIDLTESDASGFESDMKTGMLTSGSEASGGTSGTKDVATGSEASINPSGQSPCILELFEQAHKATMLPPGAAAQSEFEVLFAALNITSSIQDTQDKTAAVPSTEVCKVIVGAFLYWH